MVPPNFFADAPLNSALHFGSFSFYVGPYFAARQHRLLCRALY